MKVTISEDRATHWIKLNHQTRVPKRWIVFDTESLATISGDEEIQQWGIGAAVRWRIDLKTGDHAERLQFAEPMELWEWVTEYCKPGTRTVAMAHNLGHDVRIASALDCLPKLGWKLEWCNLDSNVSAMTWRSPKGTLVLADTWTWLPVPLAAIAPSVGMKKLDMPPRKAQLMRWVRYCANDAEILYAAWSEILDYLITNGLGNWQPTGAGMAYAVWRHKFMTHKVLVHDDIDALTAERAAMHTGRAEAWRHGTLRGDVWTEVDMRNAYVTIAAECELPCKLKFRTFGLSNKQYEQLKTTYRVLALCEVDIEVPCIPFNTGSRTIWPTGTFTTWLWDTEIDLVLETMGKVKIRDGYTYTRAPILQEWALWVLATIDTANEADSAVVRTWIKHCGRALIGRISLRAPKWQLYGDNPEGITGISRMEDAESGQIHRLMHVGNRTLIETERTEGRDSLPAVTGWVMAECRRRLWQAMSIAQTDALAHVDTDSVLVNQAGLRRLREAYGTAFDTYWQIKASYRRLIVYGPRNYRCDDLRRVAGVPRKAEEVKPNEFVGELWHGVSHDMEAGRFNRVTIQQNTWHIAGTDPRRMSAPGVGSGTVACQVVAGVLSVSSSESSSGEGS